MGAPNLRLHTHREITTVPFVRSHKVETIAEVTCEEALFGGTGNHLQRASSSLLAGVEMGKSSDLFHANLYLINLTSNDCRFPHVSSDASGPQPHLGGRAPRAREVPNGISTIEENMATMTVQVR